MDCEHDVHAIINSAVEEADRMAPCTLSGLPGTAPVHTRIHFFQHCCDRYTEELTHGGQPELLTAVLKALPGVHTNKQQEMAAVLEELAALIKRDPPVLFAVLKIDGGDTAMPDVIGAEKGEEWYTKDNEPLSH